MKNTKCSYIHCSHRVGLFLVILFVVCFAWYFINPVEQEMHLQMFKVSYLGFSGMNLTSFILGAIQTYIWAYLGVGIWQLVGCCFTSKSCSK